MALTLNQALVTEVESWGSDTYDLNDFMIVGLSREVILAAFIRFA
jgi:hypothetical protein